MKRKLKTYEEGAGVPQEPQGGAEQVVQQVAQALQQGAPIEQIVMQLLQQFQDPNQVGQILVQAGVPQEQVMQIMQQVMQQGQGEAPVEGQEPRGEHSADSMEGQEPMMAFGGPTEPPVDPAAPPVNSAKSDFRGKALFPNMYGTVDWGTREATPGIPLENRGWFDALGLSMKTNRRIRQGYVDPNGVDYGQYAKVRPRGFVVDDAEALGTFASGGPTNFKQLLEEGGAALENALRTSSKAKPFSTNSTEEYIKDMQGAFMAHVSKNNMIANLKNITQEALGIFDPAGLPKAEGGISVTEAMADLNVSQEQYDDPTNLKFKNQVDAYVQQENNRRDAKEKSATTNLNNPWTQPSYQGVGSGQSDMICTELGCFPRTSKNSPSQPQAFPQGLPWTQAWNPYGPQGGYGQRNPNMQLNPFAQILGAFQPNYGGMPNIRSRGDARGLEQAFMQNPMGGVTADGRQWSVANVERRGLFKNKLRFNLQWDGTGTPPEGVDPTVAGSNPTQAGASFEPNDDRGFRDRMVDLTSRVSPRLASRMVPSFAPNSEEPSIMQNGMPTNDYAPGVIETLRANDPNRMPTIDEYNRQRADEAAAERQAFDLRNFAAGGSFTVKNPNYNIDYGMLADGLYGAGNKVVNWANQLNTGIDPANKFNNFIPENFQGTGAPMDDGSYDQWGNWKPNDLTFPLAGRGDKSAEFASRDNNFFSGRTMAVGGSYNVGDEFDMDEAEESALSAKLKAAGYTFKRIK